MAHLYSSSVRDFVALATTGNIGTTLKQAFKTLFTYPPSAQEVTSWENSLPALAIVLKQPALADLQIFLEFKMPLASTRADVVLVGRTPTGQNLAVVIELKQWQAVGTSAIRDEVTTGTIAHLHPSAQVRGYCEFLKYYHQAFTMHGMQIAGCAFLHNMSDKPSRAILTDPARYATLPREYPLFFADGAASLSADLQRRFAGPSPTAVAWVQASAYAPSTKLLDVVDKVIQHQFEWRLLDSQLSVFNTVVSKVEVARQSTAKSIIIVRGGPGTGKSVLALQLLAYGARQHWRVSHATGSKAFITVLQAKTGAFADAYLKHIYNASYKRDLPIEKLFATFMDIANIGTLKMNELDLVVADEAHRLWDFRRRKFSNFNKQLSDTPMIEEVTRASRVTVFFIDDNQSVRADEIGQASYIEAHAKRLGIPYDVIDLNVQFRCAGSASYIDWVNHAMGYGATTSLAWRQFDGYQFHLVDSMADMEQRLGAMHDQGHTCRYVAGFCWPWSEPQGNGMLVHDVRDPRFASWSAPWIKKGDQYAKPLDSRYYAWATDDASYAQVGSIYSVQGFEFDYIGLILGEDLIWRNGHWQADLSKNKDNVFKRELKGQQPTDQLRNIYRVLLTRGMQGTFVFCLDPETRNHLAQLMQ